MKNLASIFKKLQLKGIAVISFEYSQDFDICDHEINLVNGYYVQVGSNYYRICRENSDDTFTYLGTYKNFDLMVQKLKEIF